MSVIIGNAKKFSTKAKLKTSSSDEERIRHGGFWVNNPPPPAAFDGLRTGPDSLLTVEAVKALPVDGSDKFLRSLSPFMIRLEPPLIFSSNPNIVKNYDDKGLGLYSAGLRNTGGFSSARTNVSGSTYLGTYNGASPSETIARSSPSPGTQKSGDGNQKVSKDTGRDPERLGKPAIADVKTALDIATQISTLMSTPPLVLLINPTTMSIAWNKVQQYTDRTRYGYVFHAWGEEQPRITISASCGAFLSGGRGAQWASKRDSASWQNLMSAFKFYKNNGYIYDTIGKSNAHHMVGALSIHYDGWIYYGNMESFSYSNDEGHQMGGVVFEMEFVVSSMVDTSRNSQTVQPMKSPITNTSPADLRYTGVTNTRPGATTISVDGSGTDNQSTLFGGSRGPITTKPWTPGEPDSVGNTASILGSGTVSLKPSTSGFRAPDQQIPEASVFAAVPEPFRGRS